MKGERSRPQDEESRSFMAFLISVLVPVILIFGGAGIVGLGFNMGNLPVMIVGGVLVLAGVLWGGFLLLWHGPLDWF